MARHSRSRSRSPHRERKRYASNSQRDSEDSRDSRSSRYRENSNRRGSTRRDVNDERYRSQRHDKHDSYLAGEKSSHGKSRDRSLDRHSRLKDNHYSERRSDRESHRGKDYGGDSRERYDDRQSGHNSPPGRRSRRHSHSNSRSRSRSRQRSRSVSVSEKDKGKPNFNQSGLLAAATNTVRSADGTATVLKYNEPPEARKPLVGWRLYVFKGKEQTDLLHIQRQSAYLFGRDKAIVDVYVEHPSCSKQHAVIQYRRVQDNDEFGSTKFVVKPFIIDLESTNGTQVNDEQIPVSRYYELKMGDVIKFGQSAREYVLLHDDV